jgi:carbon monoxide dehydrogenase subunit G
MHAFNRFSAFCPALLIAAVFGFVAAPASAWDWSFGAKVSGSGTIKSEARNVSGFTGVSLSIPANAEIVQGGSEGVRIETDDNILPLIETVVEDGKLKIRFKDRNMSVSTKTLKMTINVKTIDSLSVAGSGDLRASRLQVAKLKTSIAGSGDVRISALDADSLTVSIAGSGDFSAGGKANTVEAKIAGSGDMKIEKLAANNVKLSIAGSGDAAVWAKDTLTVSVAGSGDVAYYGDARVTQSVAGSGSVKRLGSAPAGS